MPAKLTKSGTSYRVSTPNMVHAKHTTKEKGEAQVRLLNAIDHGFVPRENHDRKKPTRAKR